ncbi:MAG: hypothetical protein ABI685_06665 [Ferruginibacter sp.]
MNEDLISGNFSDNVNRKFIQRYIRLLFILIILFLIFTILNFTDWYIAIKNAHPVKETLLTTFHYKIHPVLIVIEVALSALALNNYLKAQKLILHSFEKDNVELFNKGYSLLNGAAIINIAGYCMLILSISYRMFLTYLIP